MNLMDKKNIKVALIGTNGIPANYGGMETLAEYLARDLSKEYDLYCYCSKTPKEKQITHAPLFVDLERGYSKEEIEQILNGKGESLCRR